MVYVTPNERCLTPLFTVLFFFVVKLFNFIVNRWWRQWWRYWRWWDSVVIVVVVYQSSATGMICVHHACTLDVDTAHCLLVSIETGNWWTSRICCLFQKLVEPLFGRQMARIQTDGK